MQVLLARAYFRNGQKAEATDICTELLSKYPYCMDANRLMVEILPGTQRADSLQEYRNRVNELDPYAAFAQGSLFHTETVADNVVSMERLEYTGQAVDSGGALGLGLESDTTAAARTSTQPKWLQPSSTPDSGNSYSTAGASVSGSQPSTPSMGGQEEIPDFLRQAGWANSTGEFQEGSSALAEDSASLGISSGAVQGDLPDWVKALAPAGEADETPQATPSSADNQLYSADTPDWLKNLGGDQPAAPLPPVSQEASIVDTPDWLNDLGAQKIEEQGPASSLPKVNASSGKSSDWLDSLRAEPAPSQQSGGTHEETPDWLKDFDNDLETPIVKTNQPVQPSPSEPKLSGATLGAQTPPAFVPEPSGNLGSLGTTAQEQDDAMAWLESLASKHGAKPEELVTDPNARTDVAPEWVDKAKEIGEPAPALEEPVIPAADDLTGSWLRNLEASESEDQFPKKDLQESPDWNSSLKDQNVFVDLPGESRNEKPPIMDDLETPDWLSDLGPKPVQQSSIEDVPDWLHGSSNEPVRSEPVSRLSSSSRSESAVDLPDWLAGLDQEESATPAQVTSSDEVPAWLKSEIEPEPQVTEKAHPADWQPVEAKPTFEEPSEPEPAVVMESPAPIEKQVQKVEQKISEQPRPAPAKTAAPKPASAAVKAVPAAISSSLSSAQSELGRGNIAASLDIYSKLIRKGKSLEEIIRDLRDALYRYPVEVPIWQALGDAYMRANRLQEALDAYTKAEELLR